MMSDQYSESGSSHNFKEPAWITRKKRKNDLPVEDIETEGERLLKEQAKKQCNTNITLEGELRKKKQFSGPVRFEPVVAGTSGLCSLNSYKELSQKDAKLESLRSYGLSEEEIQLLLNKDLEGTIAHNAKTKLTADPLVIAQKLEIIQQKIELKQSEPKPTSFQGAKKMGRHEMDLEKAISRTKKSAQFVNILMTNKQNTSYDNKMTELLKEIELKVTGNLQSNQSFDNSDDNNCDIKIAPELYPSTGCEQCDQLRLLDRYFVGPLLKTEYEYYEKCDTCKNLKYKEEEDTNIPSDITSKKSNEKKKKKTVISEDIPLKDVEAIPKDVIEKYRLTVDQIREISKFSNYKTGEKTKILYLKNLSNKVTLEDLMSLFIHFKHSEKSPITIRLLTGKMKGQAFIHFPDEDTAECALCLVNGYDFKGKPIVIQYGKRTH